MKFLSFLTALFACSLVVFDAPAVLAQQRYKHSFDHQPAAGGEFDDLAGAPFHPAEELWQGFCDGNACSCEECSGCGCCRHPGWSASADAIYMTHQSPRALNVLLDFALTPLLNTRNLEFDHEFGARYAVSRNNILGEPLDLEVSFFEIDDWSASRAFADAGLAAGFGAGGLPYTLIADSSGGFFPAVTANFLYTSELRDVEANLKSSIADWIELQAGFRYMKYTESYQVSGTDGGPFVFPLPIAPFQQSIRTKNNLMGGQVGANVDIAEIGPWSLGVIGKVAVMFNDASMTNSYSGQFMGAVPGVITNKSTSAQSDVVSFLGEAGCNANLELGPVFSIQLGYQLMWLESVALAPDQILNTNYNAGAAAAAVTTGLDRSSNVFFHGGFVGVTATY